MRDCSDSLRATRNELAIEALALLHDVALTRTTLARNALVASQLTDIAMCDRHWSRLFVELKIDEIYICIYLH